MLNNLGAETDGAMRTALLHQSSQLLHLDIVHHQFFLIGTSTGIRHA
jgi:hypothetical protein